MVMRRLQVVGLVFALAGCASSPRTILVEVDSQLSSNATLWLLEIFNGFPMVSAHMTDRFDAPPGASIYRVETCLPAHVGGLELTPHNADGYEDRTLRYRIQILPRPEAGAMPQDKYAGAPGVVYYEPPVSPDHEVRSEKEVIRFKRAVAHAGDRRALGCWGGNIYSAMERADR
jgi:hypothetical protein